MAEVRRTARRISAKGHQRRKSIITAASELLLEKGFSAVSHRTVADRAAIPLAATTYYFSSLEDLMGEALRELARGWTAQANAAVEALPARLDSTQEVVKAILSIMVLCPTDRTATDSASLLVFYERYLESARHPHLRDAVRTFNAQLDELIMQILTRADLPPGLKSARLVLAVADGALLRAVAEGAAVKTVGPTIHQVVEQLQQCR